MLATILEQLTKSLLQGLSNVFYLRENTVKMIFLLDFKDIKLNSSCDITSACVMLFWNAFVMHFFQPIKEFHHHIANGLYFYWWNKLMLVRIFHLMFIFYSAFDVMSLLYLPLHHFVKFPNQEIRLFKDETETSKSFQSLFLKQKYRKK